MENARQPPHAGSQADQRLDSWKEIAVYVGRDVRTVQRWEKEEGLPVHRHAHKKLGTVYGFKPEIDSWWVSRRAILETKAPPRMIRFGVFELDVSAGELRKQGHKVNLQQQPFQVLVLLLRRPGEVVTREELQQALWPADTFVEFDQGLNSAIKKIRQALEDSADNPRFVETLPRNGYRFIAAVSGVESGGESSAPATVRGRRLLWIAAGLALAVAAVAVGWLLNKPNETKLNETADAALVPVPLTSYPGVEYWPIFSPDGNQVAFQWKRPDGRSEIHVKPVGEGESTRLAGGCCPAWSPDGRSIAFIDITERWSHKPGTEHGVFLISPLGGPARKLAEVRVAYAAHSLAWHPSGEWLVVTDRGSPAETDALFSLSLESGQKRRLTSPPGGFSDRFPAVSPDGEALVFGRGSMESCCGLYLLALSEEFEPKGDVKRLTSENMDGNQAAWTPDGRAIVFSSGTTHAHAVYEMPLSRPGWRPGKPRRLAFAGEGVKPAVSSQWRLAYATSNLGADIWCLELNGPGRAVAPPKVLIDSTRLDHTQEYSPDGKRIAFASNRSGSNEIWVCNSDGSDAMQLTFVGGSFYTANPTWSPDGRLILFHSNPEGRTETYVIDAEGGKPKLLFPNTRVSSWSHDGEWLYFATKEQVWKRPWPPLGQDEGVVQITRKGGHFARETPDGKVLYYEKSDEEITSLWKVPVGGGEETQVLESVCCANFAVVDEGIYFIPDWPPGEIPSIQYLSFATGKTATITTLSDFPAYGFSLSPDGRSLLYAQYQPVQGDLWMVENFR